MKTVAIVLQAVIGYAGLTFILALPFLFSPGWWILALFVGFPAIFVFTLAYVASGQVPWEIVPVLLLVLVDELIAGLVQ